jgi:hypothetical protein
MKILKNIQLSDNINEENISKGRKLLEGYLTLKANTEETISELNGQLKIAKNALLANLPSPFNKRIVKAESLLQTDREVYRSREILYRKREEELIEDVRYLQNSKQIYEIDGPKIDRQLLEIQEERVVMEEKMEDLTSENRKLKNDVDSQSHSFLKERYDMMAKIDHLKQSEQEFKELKHQKEV